MSSEATTQPEGQGAERISGKRHKAGLFDIRLIISLLLAIYGVVLTVMGFSTSDEDLAKAAGVNINLWAGLAMIVVALLFIVWALWRPLVMPASSDSTESSDDQNPQLSGRE